MNYDFAEGFGQKTLWHQPGKPLYGKRKSVLPKNAVRAGALSFTPKPAVAG
jgi:hypothetical protein